MKKTLEVLPYIPPAKGGCLGPALHGLVHPTWLEVSRRHSLSAGQGVTDPPVVTWVSSTHVRAVVHEAGLGPASAALVEAGCYECARMHPLWVLGLCWRPSPCSAEARVRQHPGSPLSFVNKLSPTNAGDVFLTCWRQSPSYSLKSSAGQGLAVLSLHKSKHH